MSQTKEKQTQQAHNIKMTSYQRRCDVITSHRRWYDVILTLCAHWENNQPPSFPPGDRNVRHDPPKIKNERDKISKSPAICHCATHQNVVVCSKVWQLGLLCLFSSIQECRQALFQSASSGISCGFVLLQYSSCVVWQPMVLQMSQHVVSVESLPLLHL